MSGVNTNVGDHRISTHRRCIYVAMFIPLGLLVVVPDFILVSSLMTDCLVMTDLFGGVDSVVA